MPPKRTRVPPKQRAPAKRRVVKRGGQAVGGKRKITWVTQHGSGIFNDYVLPNLPELHYRGFDTGFKPYSFAGKCFA